MNWGYYLPKQDSSRVLNNLNPDKITIGAVVKLSPPFEQKAWVIFLPPTMIFCFNLRCKAQLCSQDWLICSKCGILNFAQVENWSDFIFFKYWDSNIFNKNGIILNEEGFRHRCGGNQKFCGFSEIPRISGHSRFSKSSQSSQQMAKLFGSKEKLLFIKFPSLGGRYCQLLNLSIVMLINTKQARISTQTCRQQEVRLTKDSRPIFWLKMVKKIHFKTWPSQVKLRNECQIQNRVVFKFLCFALLLTPTNRRSRLVFSCYII